MKQVLKPLDPPFSAEVSSILSRYPQGKDGYIIKLFRVFANSLRFLDQKGANNLLDKGSPITLREREIIILRVTANLNCEYEWGVHVAVFSEAAELSDQQIAATHVASSDAACWADSEALLIQCVDELCDHGIILDSTYSDFQEHWTREQQLEILSLCGNYHLISFVANSARISNEDFAPGYTTLNIESQK